jgi:hypothetical protein
MRSVLLASGFGQMRGIQGAATMPGSFSAESKRVMIGRVMEADRNRKVGDILQSEA